MMGLSYHPVLQTLPGKTVQTWLKTGFLINSEVGITIAQVIFSQVLKLVYTRLVRIFL